MVNKVFKVVKNFDGILKSAIVRDLDWIVEYPPNKWVVPRVKNSKLTCFDSLQHALDFVKSCWGNVGNEFQIWEAEAINVEYAQFLGEYLLPHRFAKFWDNFDDLLLWSKGELYPSFSPPLLHSEIIQVPKGTLYAGKLKLIQKVVV